MSIDQIYHQALESLAPADRLRLATMLLETVSPSVVVDESDAWSEEDVRQYRAHCRRRLSDHDWTEVKKRLDLLLLGE